jgi:regulator of RNase E activity RraA
MNLSTRDPSVASSAVLGQKQLEGLAHFDSPTVANVVELFNLRSRVAGFSNHSLKAIYPELPPVAGYAVTATFRSGYPAEKGDSYLDMGKLVQDAASMPAPRIMVVQDLDETPRSATYGEVMVTAFQTFGFAGLITSGAGRDIEQVRQLRFPCWASSIVVSHGYCRFLNFHLPVVVGGLQVRPGDLIHADGNGIVSIPHPIAPFMLDLCQPFVQAEQGVMDCLKSTAATPGGYAAAMKKMRAEIDGLREQAQAKLKTLSNS